ncbi:MAG: acylphosphatase [Egibacteraceae bacterium]
MGERRVRVLVSGRVQGVFYRASLREEATRRGVAGTVRNLPDGRVQAELQGAPADVDAVLAWCAQGPPSAHVADVEVTELEPVPDAQGFNVR